jgi:hypothetical protein
MTRPTLPGDHDWHLFNAELGFEVAHHDGVYFARHRDRPHKVVAMLPQAWDEWRAGGPEPEGLR